MMICDIEDVDALHDGLEPFGGGSSCIPEGNQII